MRLYYDLHIHSCLSPCGCEDMTPNNIVNMSVIKGLDVISLCDHNCTANIKALSKAAQKAGILFIPGIEINTAEEVHILGLFENTENACAFGDKVYLALPDFPNNEDFFGRQLMMDENDIVTGKAEKLLISALPFSLDECVRMIREHGGAAVPAHINKGANSILNNLGFLPQNLNFTALEVFQNMPADAADLSGYRILYSSDAHFLEDISERKNYIEAEEKTISEIFKQISKSVYNF